MTTQVKTVFVKARIIRPDIESSSNEDRVIKWEKSTGGVEKTKNMISLYKERLLVNNEFFLSIQDMCLDGKIFNLEYSTKFEKAILDQNFNQLIWKDICIEVLNLIRISHPTIDKIIIEGSKKGSFYFKKNINSDIYKFITILRIFGLVTFRQTKNKRNICDIKNGDSYSDGMCVFREISQNIDAQKNESLPLNLIEGNTIPSTMVEIKNSNFSLLNLKNNSDNQTTGENSPIGNKNKIKKKTIEKNSKKDKSNWFTDKLLPILLTLLIPLVASVIWLLATGHSLQDVSGTLDSKAGLKEATTPTVLITPTPIN